MFNPTSRTVLEAILYAVLKAHEQQQSIKQAILNGAYTQQAGLVSVWIKYGYTHSTFRHVGIRWCTFRTSCKSSVVVKSMYIIWFTITNVLYEVWLEYWKMPVRFYNSTLLAVLHCWDFHCWTYINIEHNISIRILYLIEIRTTIWTELPHITAQKCVPQHVNAPNGNTYKLKMAIAFEHTGQKLKIEL